MISRSSPLAQYWACPVRLLSHLFSFSVFTNLPYMKSNLLVLLVISPLLIRPLLFLSLVYFHHNLGNLLNLLLNRVPCNVLAQLYLSLLQ